MGLKKEYKLIIAVVISVIVVLFALLFGLIYLDQYKRSLPTESFEFVNIEIPFETKLVDDWELFAHTQPQILQPGINGNIEETYKVVRSPSGEILSREKVEEKITQEVQDKIIRKGVLNYEDTVNNIRETANKAMEYVEEGAIELLFPLLSHVDKNRYSAESLKEILSVVDFEVTSHAFTESIEFIYENEDNNIKGLQVTNAEQPEETQQTTPSVDFKTPSINDETPILIDQTPASDATQVPTGEDVELPPSPRLIAKLPLEYVFSSSMTGSQKISGELILLHEDNRTWTVFYPGPTQYLRLNRKKTGDDGGKTINYPLSFEITLDHLLLFHNLDAVYVAYELLNTTADSKDLTRALDLKAKELQSKTKVPTDATPPITPEPVVLQGHLEVTSATLRDDPNTNYRLIDRNIYDSAWKTLPPGTSGKGWIKFAPAPSYEINNIILEMQVAIAGLYNPELTFGAIQLQ